MSIFLSILLSVNFLTTHPITGQANMSVFVQNMTTGEVIDSYRENHVVPPASVMKLLTTAAALETMGPGFRFPTIIEYTGTIENGTLHGDLYVRGGCDPSLGWKGRTAFLDQWVKAIQKAGIQRIDGGVIADMTMLDGEAQNPNWLKTEPEVRGLRWINHVRCEKITYDGAFVSGLPYSNERYLTGAVPSNLGTFGIKGDLPNPGLLLVRHLQARLAAAGISVKREATYIADYNPLTPPRTELYTHYSEPLSEIIKETNINSNNLYAEALFRYLGTRYTLPGTIHNSQDLLRDYWRRRGVAVQNAIIKDGCGLAPQDAVSAKAFVQLLSIMSKSPNKEAWIASLPISGKTGTLKSLCPDTPLEGRIHAKSGTIAGTKNFAGYINMPNGDTWVFAILINSAPGKARNIQTVIQQYLLDVYKHHQ